MGDAMRARAGDLSAIQEDAARARREGPGEEIEERRLARAVRADDRVQAARRDRQAHVLHRGQRAEGFAEIFCFEECHFTRRVQASTTPPRKKRTTITNATP